MTKTILVSDRRVRLVLNTFNRFFCFSEPSTMSTRSKRKSLVSNLVTVIVFKVGSGFQCSFLAKLHVQNNFDICVDFR